MDGDNEGMSDGAIDGNMLYANLNSERLLFMVFSSQ